MCFLLFVLYFECLVYKMMNAPTDIGYCDHFRLLVKAVRCAGYISVHKCTQSGRLRVAEIGRNNHDHHHSYNTYKELEAGTRWRRAVRRRCRLCRRRPRCDASPASTAAAVDPRRDAGCYRSIHTTELWAFLLRMFNWKIENRVKWQNTNVTRRCLSRRYSGGLVSVGGERHHTSEDSTAAVKNT